MMLRVSNRTWPRTALGLLLLVVCLVGAACTEQESEQDTRARKLETARKLNALPYVASSKVRPENKGLRGVVRNEVGRAYPGLNLYGSMTEHKAYLLNMSGQVVHQWQTGDLLQTREQFCLGAETLASVVGISPGYVVAEIHDDYLLAIEALGGLVKLDWDSQVQFALPNGAHHDVDTMPDGTILALTASPRWVDTGHGDIIIMDNLIDKVSAAGKLLERYSLFEILAENETTRPLVSKGLQYTRHWLAHMPEWQENEIENMPAARPSYEAMYRLFAEAYVAKTRTLSESDALYVLSLTPADMLHANTLTVLKEHPAGLWQAGNILISLRNLDLIAVLDLSTRRVVWSWGPGVMSRQHQPSVLASGNVLIFDNGTARGRSRVVEMEPQTGKIIWSYGETEATRFFCTAMGGAQGLPNGNVLITEPYAGRAFEIERDGDIVWEFFNPRQGYNPFDKRDGAEMIESLYRLGRVESGTVKQLSSGAQ